MNKTSTQKKHAEIKVTKEETSFAEIMTDGLKPVGRMSNGPDPQIIKNVLNFSKALEVLPVGYSSNGLKKTQSGKVITVNRN